MIVQRQASMFEFDPVTTLSAQVSSLHNLITTHLGNLSVGQPQAPMNMGQQKSMWCEVCGSGAHTAEYCGSNPESINFVGNIPWGGGQQQSYGNAYNQNWQNHPNFFLGGNQQGNYQSQNQYRPQGSGPQYHQQGQQYNAQGQPSNTQNRPGSLSVEDMFKQLMDQQAKMAADIRQGQLDHQNLAKQVGQLASAINTRPQGGLPGDTNPNPKQVNVITTRSGRPLTELPPKATQIEQQAVEPNVQHKEPTSMEKEVTVKAKPPPPFHKVEVFDVYQDLKLPMVYENLSFITVMNAEVAVQQIMSNDPLVRVLLGQEVDSNAKIKELVAGLELLNVSMMRKMVEPLEREFGPTSKLSIEEAPKMELKPLSPHLRPPLKPPWAMRP